VCARRPSVVQRLRQRPRANPGPALLLQQACGHLLGSVLAQHACCCRHTRSTSVADGDRPQPTHASTHNQKAGLLVKQAQQTPVAVCTLQCSARWRVRGPAAQRHAPSRPGTCSPSNYPSTTANSSSDAAAGRKECGGDMTAQAHMPHPAKRRCRQKGMWRRHDCTSPHAAPCQTLHTARPPQAVLALKQLAMTQHARRHHHNTCAAPSPAPLAPNHKYTCTHHMHAPHARTTCTQHCAAPPT
jgi:hypothetical protein